MAGSISRMYRDFSDVIAISMRISIVVSRRAILFGFIYFIFVETRCEFLSRLDVINFYQI